MQIHQSVWVSERGSRTKKITKKKKKRNSEWSRLTLVVHRLLNFIDPALHHFLVLSPQVHRGDQGRRGHAGLLVYNGLLQEALNSGNQGRLDTIQVEKAKEERKKKNRERSDLSVIGEGKRR